MKTSDYDYYLPLELIAQTPAEPRDSSRLLVLHRASGRIEHSRFDRLGEYLRAGDLLVLNDSRVIPARIHARQRDSRRRAEFLLLRRMEPGTWQAIGRPGRRLRVGERYVVEASEVAIEVVERCEDGTLVLRLSTEEGMEEWGQVPLPPYIHRPLEDRERYQTIYAREPGSAAAPTAGLHFTRELMYGLSSQGVNRV
ncbi:MAG: S-adenosylmethionine:tRNA ribosyltransferase-isomerase, partial [Chloroflexi bacterium]|nr:S-adenosylmethionine:tRNA ribosyltransferase-isomerase [Chloroflexota bacterium]